MPSLSDFPVELLLDNLFPILPVRDMLALGATSKSFHVLCEDDTMWKRRLEQDLNFSGSRTARTSGWKVIYRGLSKPKVYVWGQSDRGRLGISETSLPRARIGNVAYPIRLNIPGARIVDLAAGGWSFHALDSEGNVFVWGTLHGNSIALRRDGFAVPEKEAETPLRLELPIAIRQISCGRSHSMALDVEDRIWTFLSWGRPFRQMTSLLDRTSPESTPLQIECGWTFSSVLTQSGHVYVWILTQLRDDERYTLQMNEMNQQQNNGAFATEDGTIPCATWDYELNPHRLPALPPLPNFDDIDDSRANTRLVKIAAMEHSLIGLTNKGHVVKYDDIHITEVGVLGGHWTYLPIFSEVSRIRDLPELWGSGEKVGEGVHLQDDMRITHISAHFRTFVAYSLGSEGVVLLGQQDFKDNSTPNVISSLQNRSIISVVLGDYHYGALTADGKLLTWGAFSKGALGLGDPYYIPVGQPGGYIDEEHKQQALRFRHPPPDVRIPTEINFNHGMKKKKDTFCFATAAAGWHMAALVIDLDTDTDDGEEDPTMPGHFPEDDGLPSPNHPTHGPGEVPAIPFGRGFPLPFRIGLAGAGRGLHRGGGIWRGRGGPPN